MCRTIKTIVAFFNGRIRIRYFFFSLQKGGKNIIFFAGLNLKKTIVAFYSLVKSGVGKERKSMCTKTMVNKRMSYIPISGFIYELSKGEKSDPYH